MIKKLMIMKEILGGLGDPKTAAKNTSTPLAQLLSEQCIIRLGSPQLSPFILFTENLKRLIFHFLHSGGKFKI